MQVSLPRRWNPLLFILPGSTASSHYASYRQGPYLQDLPSESGNRQRDCSEPQTAVVVNHQDRPGGVESTDVAYGVAPLVSGVVMCQVPCNGAVPVADRTVSGAIGHRSPSPFRRPAEDR